MEPMRWVNQSQPQTLVIATILLYADAVLGLLLGSLYFFFGVLPGMMALIGMGVAAWGIANERSWAYLLGVFLAGLGVFFLVLVLTFEGIGALFDLNFLILAAPVMAQFLLLVHPQSREYQRIWFR